MSGRIARLSSSAAPFTDSKWACKKPWPDDCFVQCGDGGIVFVENAVPDEEPIYETAFFEAFPRNPNTFIRGEGATIEEAEASAWNKFEKYCACPGHEFERRNYKNGAGFCKHCNMFGSKAFEPIRYPCAKCGASTCFMHDKDGDAWCRQCWREMPEEKRMIYWDHYVSNERLLRRYTENYCADFADGGLS